MRRPILFVALLTIGFSFNALAMDGNELYQHCGSPASENNSGDALFCYGYIRGAFDSLIYSPLHNAYCPPPNMTVQQGTDIVSKFLADNPKYRSLDGPLLVVAALKMAFPCKKPLK